MTQVTISLPEDLAQRARDAGLLSNNGIQRLLENAMRARDAGARLNALLAKVDARPEPAPSEADIAEEVAQARRDACHDAELALLPGRNSMSASCTSVDAPSSNSIGYIQVGPLL